MDPPPAAADDNPAASTVDGTAEATRVAAALAGLRRDDAEILRLWAWDELQSPQIAVVLGISSNAAAIRLHRAKSRLKQELLKSGNLAGHSAHDEGSEDARR